MPVSTRRTPGRRCLERLLALADARVRHHRRLVFPADRPAAIPQVEARPLPHRVLLRGGERRERADVAPVAALLEVLYPRHAVLAEVVRIDALALADARQHIAPEVHFPALARLAHHALERFRMEHVVAHRGVGVTRIAGDRARLLRLLAGI